MVREDGKRNFVLVEDGEETSVFSGTYPRQAALKAARRLHPAPSPDDIDGKATLRLRERGTDRVHIYEGWAWTEEKDDDAPEWMDDHVTRANVSKQGIEHLEA
ncbi:MULTISPECIES: non-histone chromosomal MC1 family protein [Haloferax]|nr:MULTISPECIES: non-histone chromosomal MC1 family protein [Haloferax]ELK50152.1 nonhistone chromosomal protein [Haloferax sp. BAB-2207]ELZ60946.1 nonhistone chromosomal protein [Haloferax sp. ATCC BAA-646]ELZ64263.1 nonhistone chromosomal protein [Haloferax sp. ATCC BAA-645]ELZ69901.1 nonhistone chromosomal protein [Haloferax sp. ATCC BAA-644]ELZ74658.1 nonhistone chromosomal protein [Haloferax lucentense DSM 14919]